MKLIWLISLVFFTQIGIAQISMGVVKGKVVQKSGEPLAYANLVFTQNGQVIKGLSADMNGSFQISLAKGNYQLSASYIGFTTKITNLNVEPHGQVLQLALEQGYLVKEMVVKAYLVQITGYFGLTNSTKLAPQPERKVVKSPNIKPQKIYPNPTLGAFTIQSTVEITRVVVMNLLGRVVLSQNKPATRQELNIGHLPSGLYIVNYLYSGTWFSEKLVLTK